VSSDLLGQQGDDVHFSVLGPVRVWRGPAELDLGPHQQRAMLALLLLRANYLVTIDELVALLWEGDPPNSAVNVIHKYIGAIRRLLEPDLEARSSGRWVTRQGAAYRLIADESTSDLIRFRRLVREARSAHGGNRPGDALDLLMDALGLHRGPCGGGLELYGQRDHFAAVDQEYVGAVAEAADAALACGQPVQILPVLRQAAADEPLNESLQARLILLLAATGQQALALAHYQTVRERLSDELGVDPGAELRAAHGQVLRQEVPTAASLGAGETAGDPEPARPPQTPAASVAALPRVPSPLVPPAQLPADLPTFAGRVAELATAAKMLSPDGESPIVAVCAVDGMAGIGKTTFAIHWAHHVKKHFEDGQLYLNLRGFDENAAAMEPAYALRALLDSLGVPASQIPDDLDARAGLYRSVLAGKRVLIVLDNARDVNQVRPLLPGSPGCLVIATSRNPLVGLAMFEGARLLTLKLPSALTARETLERRLGVDRVAAEREAAEEIIELCGRLPLALAIASARAAAHPDFTLASVAADLRRSRGRLDGFGAAGVTADARTVFSWSYDHLSEPASRLFRLLSLQPAADITAAASASLLGTAPNVARRLIAELTSTALISEHQPGRYAFHELTRVYAAELSEGTDTAAERHAALSRQLDHYLQSSYAAHVELRPHREPIAPDPPRPGVTPERFADYESAMSWFAAEHHVLTALVALAAASDFGFPAWQLALTMQQFCQWRGLFHDWKQVMEAALRAAERDGDLPGQGHVLRSLAGASFYLNRLDECVRYLERAQASYTALGYTTEHAYLHSSFAEVFTRQGQLPLAIEHNRKALELYRAAGYRRGEARAIADIGETLHALGDDEEAVTYLERGIALAQEVRKPHQEGKARKDLGIVLAKLGQLDSAIDQFRQALVLIRGVGSLQLEAETLLPLGDALAAQGRADEARDAWRQASSIVSAFGLPQDDEANSRLLRYEESLAVSDDDA
jgi:DNA-binding SARP family transcriptional activator/tetratricopeptide (TPR) repeat protein